MPPLGGWGPKDRNQCINNRKAKFKIIPDLTYFCLYKTDDNAKQTVSL
jgi:hypothetical protein